MLESYYSSFKVLAYAWCVVFAFVFCCLLLVLAMFIGALVGTSAVTVVRRCTEGIRTKFNDLETAAICSVDTVSAPSIADLERQ